MQEQRVEVDKVTTYKQRIKPVDKKKSVQIPIQLGPFSIPLSLSQTRAVQSNPIKARRQLCQS